MVSAHSVPVLIRALSRGGYLAHNAQRILGQIVGADAVALCDERTACWSRWWQRHHERLGLDRPG